MKKTKSSVINNGTYQRETFSERPIRLPLRALIRKASVRDVKLTS